MSVTAFDHDAACKTLEDAGFTAAQVAALLAVTRQPIAFGTLVSGEKDASARSQRDTRSSRGGSLVHAIMMLMLAVAGLGALLTVLVRVA